MNPSSHMTHPDDLRAFEQARIDRCRSVRRVTLARHARCVSEQWFEEIQRSTTGEGAVRAAMQGVFDDTDRDYCEDPALPGWGCSTRTVFARWIEGALTDEEVYGALPLDSGDALREAVASVGLQRLDARLASSPRESWARPWFDELYEERALCSLVDPSESELWLRPLVDPHTRRALAERVERDVAWNCPILHAEDASVASAVTTLVLALLQEDRAATQAIHGALMARSLGEVRSEFSCRSPDAREAIALACASLGRCDLGAVWLERVLAHPRSVRYLSRDFTEPPNHRTVVAVLSGLADLERAEFVQRAKHRVTQRACEASPSAAEWLALARWADESDATQFVARALESIERDEVPFDSRLLPDVAYRSTVAKSVDRLERWLDTEEARRDEEEDTNDQAERNAFRWFWLRPEDDAAIDRAARVGRHQRSIDWARSSVVASSARRWLSTLSVSAPAATYAAHALQIQQCWPCDTPASQGVARAITALARSADPTVRERWLRSLSAASRERVQRWLDGSREIGGEPSEPQSELVSAYASADPLRWIAVARANPALAQSSSFELRFGYTVREVFLLLAEPSDIERLAAAILALDAWAASDEVCTPQQFDAEGLLRFDALP